MNNEVPFRFGIRRLMLVTFLVAVIMSIAIRIGVVAQMFFGCILLFMLIWAFFRGRRFVAGLKTMIRLRRDVMQRRALLAQELQQAFQSRNSMKSTANHRACNDEASH